MEIPNAFEAKEFRMGQFFAVAGSYPEFPDN